MADSNDGPRFDVAKIVVLSGWSLTILICIGVIGTAIFMVLTRPAIDASIDKWASTCLGFLFGAFVSLVKDFITSKDGGSIGTQVK